MIIRKPKVVVNEQNYQILQFLDLVEKIDYYAEIEGSELKRRLQIYLQQSMITQEKVELYFKYYSDEVCENYLRLLSRGKGDEKE